MPKKQLDRRLAAKNYWKHRRYAQDVASSFLVAADGQANRTEEATPRIDPGAAPGDLSGLRASSSALRYNPNPGSREQRRESVRRGSIGANPTESKRSERALSKEAYANIRRIKALGGELRRASVVVQGLFSEVDVSYEPKRPKGVTAREFTLRKSVKGGTVAPHDRDEQGRLAFDIDETVGSSSKRKRPSVVAGSSMSAGAAYLRLEIKQKAIAEQEKADAVLGKIGILLTDEERGTAVQQAKKRAGLQAGTPLSDLDSRSARRVAIYLLQKDTGYEAEMYAEAWGWLLDKPKVKYMLRNRPGLIDPRSAIGALAQREVEVEDMAKAEARELKTMKADRGSFTTAKYQQGSRGAPGGPLASLRHAKPSSPLKEARRLQPSVGTPRQHHLDLSTKRASPRESPGQSGLSSVAASPMKPSKYVGLVGNAGRRRVGTAPVGSARNRSRGIAAGVEHKEAFDHVAGRMQAISIQGEKGRRRLGRITRGLEAGAGAKGALALPVADQYVDDRGPWAVLSRKARRPDDKPAWRPVASKPLAVEKASSPAVIRLSTSIGHKALGTAGQSARLSTAFVDSSLADYGHLSARARSRVAQDQGKWPDDWWDGWVDQDGVLESLQATAGKIQGDVEGKGDADTDPHSKHSGSAAEPVLRTPFDRSHRRSSIGSVFSRDGGGLSPEVQSAAEPMPAGGSQGESIADDIHPSIVPVYFRHRGRGVLSLNRAQSRGSPSGYDYNDARKYSILESQTSLQTRPSTSISGYQQAGRISQQGTEGPHDSPVEDNDHRGAARYQLPPPESVQPHERRRILKGSPSLLAVPESPKNAARTDTLLQSKGGVATPRFGSGPPVKYSRFMRRRDSTRSKPRGALSLYKTSQQSVKTYLRLLVPRHAIKRSAAATRLDSVHKARKRFEERYRDGGSTQRESTPRKRRNKDLKWPGKEEDAQQTGTLAGNSGVKADPKNRRRSISLQQWEAYFETVAIAREGERLRQAQAEAATGAGYYSESDLAEAASRLRSRRVSQDLHSKRSTYSKEVSKRSGLMATIHSLGLDADEIGYFGGLDGREDSSDCGPEAGEEGLKRASMATSQGGELESVQARVPFAASTLDFDGDSMTGDSGFPRLDTSDAAGLVGAQLAPSPTMGGTRHSPSDLFALTAVYLESPTSYSHREPATHGYHSEPEDSETAHELRGGAMSDSEHRRPGTERGTRSRHRDSKGSGRGGGKVSGSGPDDTRGIGSLESEILNARVGRVYNETIHTLRERVMTVQQDPKLRRAVRAGLAALRTLPPEIRDTPAARMQHRLETLQKNPDAGDALAYQVAVHRLQRIARSGGRDIVRENALFCVQRSAPYSQWLARKYRAKEYQRRLDTTRARRQRLEDRRIALAFGFQGRRRMHLEARKLYERRATWLTIIKLVTAVRKVAKGLAEDRMRKINLAGALFIQRLWRGAKERIWTRRFRGSRGMIIRAIGRFRLATRIRSKRRAGELIRYFLREHVLSIHGARIRLHIRKLVERVISVQRAIRRHLACSTARLELLGLMWRREEGRLRSKLKWRQAAASAKLSSFRLAASHPLAAGGGKYPQPPSSPMGTSTSSIGEKAEQMAVAIHKFGSVQRMRSSRLVMKPKSGREESSAKAPVPAASSAGGAWGAALELISIKEKYQQDNARQQQVDSIRQQTESQLTGKGASLHEMGQLHERVSKVGDDLAGTGTRGSDHLLRAAKSASPTSYSAKLATKGKSIRYLFRASSMDDEHDAVGASIPRSPNGKPQPPSASAVQSLNSRTPRGLLAAPAIATFEDAAIGGKASPRPPQGYYRVGSQRPVGVGGRRVGLATPEPELGTGGQATAAKRSRLRPLDTTLSAGGGPPVLPSEAFSFGPFTSAASGSVRGGSSVGDGSSTPGTPVGATAVVREAMEYDEASLLSDPLVLRSLNHQINAGTRLAVLKQYYRRRLREHAKTVAVHRLAAIEAAIADLRASKRAQRRKQVKSVAVMAFSSAIQMKGSGAGDEVKGRPFSLQTKTPLPPASPSLGAATGISDAFGFDEESDFDEASELPPGTPASVSRGDQRHMTAPPSASSRAHSLRMRLRAHAQTPRDSKHVLKLLRAARVQRESDEEKKAVAAALSNYVAPPLLLVTGTRAGTMQQLLLKAHKLAAAQEAASHSKRGGRAKARRRRGSNSSRGSRGSHGSRSSSRSGSSKTRRSTRIFRRQGSRTRSRLQEHRG